MVVVWLKGEDHAQRWPASVRKAAQTRSFTSRPLRTSPLSRTLFVTVTFRHLIVVLETGRMWVAGTRPRDLSFRFL